MSLDVTPLGFELPHPDNDPRNVDVPRLRSAITKIDSFVAALQADKATTAQVDASIQVAINALKAGVPEAFDTLIEIADKLGDNDDVVAGIVTSLGLKASAASVSSLATDLANEITARQAAVAAEAAARAAAFGALRAVEFEGVSADANLVAGKAYRLLAPGITLTLPESPQVGDTIRLVDGEIIDTENTVTIARNSNTIMGLNEDLTVNTMGIRLEIWWSGSDWRLF